MRTESCSADCDRPATSISPVAPARRLLLLGSLPPIGPLIFVRRAPTVPSLSAAAELEVLELGFNRIAAIEGLDRLTKLRELWLGRNRIASIPDLSPYVL